MRKTIAHWMIVGFIAATFSGCQGGLGMPRWDWWRTADNEDPAAASNLAGSPYNSGIPSATASYPGSSTKGGTSLPNSGPGSSTLSKSGLAYPGSSPNPAATNPYGRGNVTPSPSPSQPGLGTSNYSELANRNSAPDTGTFPTNRYPNTNPGAGPSSTAGTGMRYPSTSTQSYPETPVSYPNPNMQTASPFAPQTKPYGGSYGNPSASGSGVGAPSTSSGTTGIGVQTPPATGAAGTNVPYTGMQITTPNRPGSSRFGSGNPVDNNATSGITPPAGNSNLGPRYGDIPGSGSAAPPSTPGLPVAAPKSAAPSGTYVPGATSYQPGNTGYNPPNVPRYQVPSYQSPGAGTNPLSSGQNSSSPYLPGSTSTYSPANSGLTPPTTSVPAPSPSTATYPGAPAATGTGIATPPTNSAPSPGIPPAQTYQPPATYPSTGY